MELAFSANLTDRSLNVQAHCKDWRDRRTAAKTRVYVSLQDGDVQMEEPPVGTQGVNAENDKLWRKYHRLEIAAMKAKIEKALPAIAAACGPMVKLGTTKAVSLSIDDFRFSRKAGCSCPCSPGFIYDGRIWSSGDGPIDLWISAAKTADHQRDQNRRAAERELAKAQEALDRAAAIYGASVAEILDES
jgi:hypothetical protein